MSEEQTETEKAKDIEIQELENKRQQTKKEIKHFKSTIKMWMVNDFASIHDVLLCTPYQIVFSFKHTSLADLDTIKLWVESRGYKFDHDVNNKKFYILSPETLQILKKTHPYNTYDVVDIHVCPVEAPALPKYVPVQLFYNDNFNNKQYEKLCKDIQYLHDTVGHISYIIQEQNEKLDNIYTCVDSINDIVKALNKQISTPSSPIDTIVEFCKEVSRKLSGLFDKKK